MEQYKSKLMEGRDTEEQNKIGKLFSEVQGSIHEKEMRRRELV